MSKEYISVRKELANQAAVEAMIATQPSQWPLGSIIVSGDGVAHIVTDDIGTIGAMNTAPPFAENHIPFPSGNFTEDDGGMWEHYGGTGIRTFNDPTTTIDDTSASDSANSSVNSLNTGGVIVERLTIRLIITKNAVALYPAFQIDYYDAGGSFYDLFNAILDPLTGAIHYEDGPYESGTVTFDSQVNDTNVEFVWQIEPAGETIGYYDMYLKQAYGNVFPTGNGAAVGANTFENLEFYYNGPAIADVLGQPINYATP